MANHGEGQQPTQVALPEGQQRAIEHPDQTERDYSRFPLLGSGWQQRKNEPQQCVDAHLRADQKNNAYGDRAMSGDNRQPGMKGEQRQSYRQSGQ